MKRVEYAAASANLARNVLACMVVLAMVAGCADPFLLADDAQWYPARVVNVVAALDVDRDANRQCVERLAPMPDRVAVVSVRMHRGSHLAAFAIPASVLVEEKDSVRVNFRLCQLRLPSP